jgi:outer membrane protein TolC
MDNKQTTSEGVAAIMPTMMASSPPLSSALAGIKASDPDIEFPEGMDVYFSAPYSVEVPRWHMFGSFSASLGINFALFEGMRSLKLTYQAGLITYEKARVQLERDVRKSYYSMLLLQENIGLLRGSFEAAQRRMEMARVNYRSGLIPEVNYLQAQVAVENMRPSMDQAENGLKMQMANFAMTLNLPYNTQFELVPVNTEINAIPLDVTDLIHRAATKRLDIQELQQNILVLQSNRTALIQQIYTPNLSVSWSISPVFIKDPWKDTWFEKDNWNSSGNLQFALQFPLHNMLPWSPTYQNVKSLEDNVRNMNINLARTIRGSELEIYSNVFTLEQAIASAEAQGHTVDLAERTYRLTEQSYRLGGTDLLEVQNAELELQKARLGVLEQNFNYFRGLIDLEYAVGVPFGSLSAIKNNQE